MSTQNVRERILNKAKEAKRPTTPASSDTPAAKPKASKEPLAYIDSAKNGYWTKNARGEYIPTAESSLRRILKYQHFQDIDDKVLQIAKIDKMLIELQQEHDVAFAGPIAGYRQGLHEICNQRVLVTTGPRLMKWTEGPFPLFQKLIDELLGDKKGIFFAWLKCGLRSLYSGAPFRPGQMLALAGPAGCGKSLLQNLLTEMFGGRSAKPYRYMVGDTSFNSDLFQNEHLMIEDDVASTDLRIRRHFGSQLKNMIANEVQSLHRKSRDALSMSVFWRVTITVNDEPENLMVLPPIDESLRDKITLLRARPATFPYGKDDIPGRNSYRASLSKELPHFMHWLRSYRIPDRLLNQRYGVAAYQEPELLRELEDLAPETKLWTIINDLRIWGIDNEPFEGTAAELEKMLLEKDKLGQVRSVLSYNSACGVYLKRLMIRYPNRISEKRSHSHGRIWAILPPP